MVLAVGCCSCDNVAAEFASSVSPALSVPALPLLLEAAWSATE